MGVLGRVAGARVGGGEPLLDAGAGTAMLDGARRATAGGIVLVLTAAGLLLARRVDPADDVDEHALRWHVLVRDLWFLVWDLTLLAAVRRRPRR